MKKRIFTFLLAGLMAAGMVSCGSGPQSSTETSTETSTGGDSSASESSEQTGDSGEVISLDILSMPANKSGIIEGWWADDVREKLGIEFNLLPSDDQGEQKLQALMASGELPDLVIFKDYKQVENAVVGNMLLAFDDYKDLVPNVYANAAESLQHTADTLSDGQGKSFVVGTGIKHYPDSRGWSGLQVRYDLYKEIGSPEVGTLMDLVPVIQEMQALEPENADGKKVYGLSLFKDWDRSYMTVGMFAAGTMGYEIPGEGTLVQIDYRNDPNGVVDSLLVEDGVYMQFLDFCFALNQLDLLDPDSLTQRFDDYMGKVGDGRTIMTAFGDWGVPTFNTYEQKQKGVGYMPIPLMDVPYKIGGTQPIGNQWTIGVSSATEYPEKCMEFVNYFYDYDANMFAVNGVQGPDALWDYDENGQPYRTETYYEFANNPEKLLPDGRKHDQGGSPLTASAFFANEINPNTGLPLDSQYWPEKDYAPEKTLLETTWMEDYDANDSVDYSVKNNLVVEKPFFIAPLMTDEMEQISSRVGDVVKTISWQMIFAKDEAEFNALKEEMISKAEGLGINDFLEWFKVEYENALEFGKQYTE